MGYIFLISIVITIVMVMPLRDFVPYDIYDVFMCAVTNVVMIILKDLGSYGILFFE
jgi:hypothetical protein